MKIDEIKKAKTKKVGKDIEYFKEIDSTHKYAQRILEKTKSKECDGKTIIAEVQTDGIGTKGRKWYTGESKNIAMTIILNTDRKAKELRDLPFEVAKAIKKSIFELYDCELKIKLPNDLMLNDKKICGILTQINTQGEKVKYVLISFGFNVNEEYFEINSNTKETEQKEDLKNIATSLKNELKKEFRREEIITKILENIEKINI